MPPSPPKPLLRRLVADLAASHSDDMAAVLDDLDPGQRQQVEALLLEFAGQRTAPRSPDSRAGFDRSRLSPWLVERLDDCGHEVTAHAREALRACAVRLYPSPTEGNASRARAGFSDKVASLLSLGRVAS